MIHKHFWHQYSFGRTLGESLAAVAASSLESITFIDRDGNLDELPYQKLLNQAAMAGQMLRQRGMATGDTVLLVIDDEASLVRAFWAVILGGGVPAPLTPPASYSASDSALQKIERIALQCASLNHAEPWLLTDLDPERLATLPGLQSCRQASRMIDTASLQVTDQAPISISAVRVDPDSTAFLMFSSGSTGDPKGVRLTHRQLACNLAQIAERSALDSSDRSLSWLPLTHDMGLVLFHLCHTLAGIAQFKITPLSFARAPQLLPELASQLGITLLGMPNFGFDQLCRAARQHPDARWNLHRVRLIYNGAEPISPALCRRFVQQFAVFGLSPTAISPGWGIAEACVVATAFSTGQLRQQGMLQSRWIRGGTDLKAGRPVRTGRADDPDCLELVGLGEPVTGMCIQVLDDQQRPLPERHLGHLRISGPNVSNGYFGQPDSRWCDTGDLGFIEQGIVYLAGRDKDVLFINGRNHFSNDLENWLSQALDWPAGQLAVVGLTDPVQARERVVLFFRHRRADGDAALPARRLRHALESRLGYPVAAAIPVPTLPKTTSGKIRRFALREALKDGDYDHWLAEAAHGTPPAPQPAAALPPSAGSGTPGKPALQPATPPTTAAAPLPAQPPQGHDKLQRLKAHLARIIDGLEPAQISDTSLPLSHYGLDSVGYLQLAAALGEEDGADYDASAWMQAGTLENIAQLLHSGSSQPAQAPAPAGPQQLPLSARQRSLWSALEAERQQARPPGLPEQYTEAYWLEFCGEMDARRWLAAADEVLGQHPLLWAVLAETADGPVFRITGKARWQLQHIPCPSSAFAEKSQALACVPVDLANGPLLRIWLLQASDQAQDTSRWRLCLQTHHILADGWSLHMLLSQCFARYAGQPLPPAGSGLYSDDAGMPEAEVRAWCEQIKESGALALQPASNLSRTAGPVHIRSAILEDPLSQRIRMMSREGTHTFTVITAMLMALLGRMAQVDQPLIGTVASGRTQRASHHRFAYLARTHALAGKLAPQTTLNSLIQQLEGQRQSILARQLPDMSDLQSFSEGQSVLQKVRVVHVHQNMPAITLAPGLSWQGEGAHRGIARVDLCITSQWRGNQLHIDWEYDSHRLGSQQIEDLIELFAHLLAQALDEPERPLASLSLLSPAQARIWAAFQGPVKALDNSSDLIERIRSCARHYPEHIAVSDGSEQIGYRTLQQRMDALCWHLQEHHGLQAGQRVALFTSRETGYVIGLLALLKLGLVAVPLDPALPAERLGWIIEKSGAALLLTTGSNTVIDPAVIGQRPRFDFDSRQLSRRTAHTGHPLQADDPAYLIFTSGSTGEPKGVTITHRSLVNLVDWVIDAFHYRAGETICQFAPFSFDVSMAEILPSLCAGMHVHVLDDHTRQTPAAYLQAMARTGAQVATLTPAYVDVLNEMPEVCRQSLGALRLLILGGEGLRAETVRRWREHSPQVAIVNVYGPTETTVMSSAWPVPAQPAERHILPIGQPISNTEFWLLDEQQQPCPRGVSGTLYIGGAGLAQGYWQDPQRTAASFVTLSPDGGPPRRFYNTGDLARLAFDGALDFIGRADGQVKLRGFRIELGEIEQAMHDVAGVDQAVVCVVERETGGDRALVAYWSGAQQDPRAIAQRLQQRLPAYMLPAAWQHIEQWPLSANRKIDRRRLPAPDWRASARHSMAAERASAPAAATDSAPAHPAHPAPPALPKARHTDPAANTDTPAADHSGSGDSSSGGSDSGSLTGTEQQLAQFWTELLGLSPIRREDNFMLLGGNSLGIARLHTRISRQMQRDVPLAALQQADNLASMAALIDAAPHSAATPAAAPLAPAARFPFRASDAQARMVFLEQANPASAINNIPLTLKLGAALDAERLKRAIRILYQRHALLRARFELSNDGVMVVDGASPPSLRQHSFASRRQALHWLAAFQAHPYRLDQGPLWRMALVTASEDGSTRHWLAFSMHHAISDGVTLTSLLNELDALLGGQQLPDISARPGYADYVAWQAQWLESSEASQARRYWSNRRNLPEALSLPPNPTANRSDPVSGRQFVFEFDEQLSRNLAQIASDNKVSPFVLMCTMFCFMLSEQCHTRSMSVGITLSGRSQPHFESVIGLMVNTLPMAFVCQDSDTFSDLLRQVADRVNHLLSVQDYPLNRVMAQHQLSGTPFSVLFNEEILPARLSIGGITAELEAVGSGIARLPLVISFLLDADRWRTRLEVRNDVCPPAWIATFLRDLQHFATHLEGMSHARAQDLRGIDDQLMSLLERH